MVLPPCLLAQIRAYVKYYDKSLNYSIVYLLLPHCRIFYLYWWQHGGRGSFCGDVRLHCSANALPAAINALLPPPPLRCLHLHRGATAKDAALLPGYRNVVKLAATATLPPPPPPPPATLTLPMLLPRCPPLLHRCCYLPPFPRPVKNCQRLRVGPFFGNFVGKQHQPTSDQCPPYH
jgi:hypothetical protein